MNKAKIRELALANGFKLKEQPDGTMELNPYVYEFASALMADAGREGFVHGAYACASSNLLTFSVAREANQYAEKIRQGGKS